MNPLPSLLFSLSPSLLPLSPSLLPGPPGGEPHLGGGRRRPLRPLTRSRPRAGTGERSSSLHNNTAPCDTSLTHALALEQASAASERSSLLRNDTIPCDTSLTNIHLYLTFIFSTCLILILLDGAGDHSE